MIALIKVRNVQQIVNGNHEFNRKNENYLIELKEEEEKNKPEIRK